MPGIEGPPQSARRVAHRRPHRGPPPACPGRTAVVNRHGALLLSPRAYELGTQLRLRNLESKERVACHVVWAGGQDDRGSQELGVEFSEERSDFWGRDYESAILAEEKDVG